MSIQLQVRRNAVWCHVAEVDADFILPSKFRTRFRLWDRAKERAIAGFQNPNPMPHLEPPVRLLKLEKPEALEQKTPRNDPPSRSVRKKSKAGRYPIFSEI